MSCSAEQELAALRELINDASVLDGVMMVSRSSLISYVDDLELAVEREMDELQDRVKELTDAIVTR